MLCGEMEAALNHTLNKDCDYDTLSKINNASQLPLVEESSLSQQHDSDEWMKVDYEQLENMLAKEINHSVISATNKVGVARRRFRTGECYN